MLMFFGLLFICDILLKFKKEKETTKPKLSINDFKINIIGINSKLRTKNIIAELSDNLTEFINYSIYENEKNNILFKPNKITFIDTWKFPNYIEEIVKFKIVVDFENYEITIKQL